MKTSGGRNVCWTTPPKLLTPSLVPQWSQLTLWEERKARDHVLLVVVIVIRTAQSRSLYKILLVFKTSDIAQNLICEIAVLQYFFLCITYEREF